MNFRKAIASLFAKWYLDRSTTIINFWHIERGAYAYSAHLKVLKDIQLLFMNKKNMLLLNDKIMLGKDGR